MPCYVKQRNNFSCAPVSIINTSKWLRNNLSLSYRKDYKRIVSLTKCDKFHGTSHEDIDFALRYLFNKEAKVTKIKNISIERIKNHFFKNGSMLLSFGYLVNNVVNGHIVFISQYKNKNFLVHNMDDKTSIWISENDIEKCANHKCIEIDGTKYPAIWLIKRK